jgi:hypothetical protein
MLSHKERQTGAGSGALKCLQSLTNFSLPERDLEFIYEVLCLSYQDSALPMEGNVPQVNPGSMGFVPRLQRNELLVNPHENTIAYWYSGTALLTKRGTVKAEIRYGAGDTFSGNTTEHITYLEKLGYLNRETQKEIYLGEFGYRLLIKEFVNPELAVYTFTVIKDIPIIFIL